MKLQSALNLLPALRIGEVGARSDIVQAARLPGGRRRVPEGIATRKELKLVEPVIRVECEEQVGAEKVRITGSNVRRTDLRALVLAGGFLIERVGLLEPGTLRGEI